MESHVKVYDQVSYTAFLVPGLAMMSLLQNAFANSSSSLIMSKVMGNLVFLLLTPLSYLHWFVAYVGASVLRGLVVGVGVLMASAFFANFGFAAPLWILAFAVMGAGPVSYTHLDVYKRQLQATDMLEQVALDPYTFVRDAYLQRRRSSIYDGNPPDEGDSLSLIHI